MTRRLLPLVLTLALLASGCGVLGEPGAYPLTIELTRSYNLFPGSPVRVLGVDVGRISDIRVEAGSEVVEVLVRIDGDVDIPADAGAIVVPESLLGERYIQLPPYVDGPRLPAGDVIPVDRTSVPFEFDEVLEGLNRFVDGLDEDEVARFVSNLAEVVDGQGEQLGRTIDQATDAIGVLQDNDEELVALVSRLADLNQTLSSRDTELAALLRDFDLLAASLVADRNDLDAALVGLVRLTRSLSGLLEANRERLQADIEVLTRIGRTTRRNLDNVSMAVLGSAELFRHAERIVDRELNMIPLQAQLFPLLPVITESIVFRLQGLCLQAGLPEESCALDVLEDLLGGLVCAPPMVPCPAGGEAVPIEEALLNLMTGDPELGDALLAEMEKNVTASREREQAEAAREDESGGPLDDLLDGLGGLFGGRR